MMTTILSYHKMLDSFSLTSINITSSQEGPISFTRTFSSISTVRKVASTQSVDLIYSNSGSILILTGT